MSHSPDDNGTASSISTITDKRIKKYVFDFYDSTTTGAFSDTKAGQSIFKNTRLLLALGVVALSLGYALTRYFTGGSIIQTTKAGQQPPVSEVVQKVPGSPAASGAGVSLPAVVNQSGDSDDGLAPYFEQSMDVVGHIQGKKHFYLFAVQKGGCMDQVKF